MVATVEDGRIILIPASVIPDDQAWFWTPEWQAREAEADQEVAVSDRESSLITARSGTPWARSTSSEPSQMRLLFIFDPQRRAVFLVGGNKAGKWSEWYKAAIPQAEDAYAEHLLFEEKKK